MTTHKRLLAQRRGHTLYRVLDSKGKVSHYLVDDKAITNYREALERFKRLVNPKRYGSG